MKQPSADATWRVLAIVAVSCLVVITVSLVRRELVTPEVDAGTIARSAVRTSRGSQPPVRVNEWERIAQKGHRIGSVSAPVTIVEFADFECPACRKFALETFPAVQRQFPDQVALVYRHYPLQSHAMALPAARAAECAAAQGRFEAFHDLLFVRRDSLRTGAFSWIAREAGVRDLSAFDACLGQDGSLKSVESDLAEVRRIGGSGTPTLVINGLLIRPPYSLAAVSRHVEAALAVAQR